MFVKDRTKSKGDGSGTFTYSGELCHLWIGVDVAPLVLLSTEPRLEDVAPVSRGGNVVVSVLHLCEQKKQGSGECVCLEWGES